MNPYVIPYISGDIPYITGIQPIYEVGCTPTQGRQLGIYLENLGTIVALWQSTMAS